MTPLELVRRLRLSLGEDFGRDRDPPLDWEVEDGDLLWSNDELVGYLQDAVDEYCERQPIVDNQTADVCTVTAAAADAGHVVTDPRVLRVREVRVASDERLVKKADRRDFDRTSRSWSTQTATTPTAYIDDQNSNGFRIVPAPESDLELILVVDRYSLEQLAWADRATQQLEVPRADQRALIHWAAAQAYLRHEEETFDQNAAESRMALFDRLIGPRVTPKQRAARRYAADMSPGTIAYSR